jgi:hypothetical protein
VDPDSDPTGATLFLSAASGSGPRRTNMTHKNRKKLINFIFVSAGCSLLRAEGFSCSLNALYGGLGIFFSCIFFLKFLVMKPMDTDPDSLEMLVPDPDYCFKC